MIDSAIVLLAREGYQATSFSTVLEASGAPRGSIYHHFPGGKDELIGAALRTHGDRVFGRLGTLTGRPATEIVETFFAWWRLGLVASDFAVGCSLVAVTASAGPGELRTQTGGLFLEWRGVLEDLLRTGGATDARAFAAELLAAAEGAVVIARAEHSFEAFDLVAARLEAEAERLLGAAR